MLRCGGRVDREERGSDRARVDTPNDDDGGDDTSFPCDRRNLRIPNDLSLILIGRSREDVI